MENGPWMIRTAPIILNKWAANVSLMKEDLTRVSVWVKLHDVPLTGYNEYGLSMIASKIGKPIMLDSYTSTMCVEAWGRPNYARAMIEIRCKVFGHGDVHCPKNISIPVAMKRIDSEGFQVVKVTKNSVNYTNQNQRQTDGFIVGRRQQKMVYTPTNSVTQVGSTSGVTESPVDNQARKKDEVPMSNTYAALDGIKEDVETNTFKIVDELSDIEQKHNEITAFMVPPFEGASTPSIDESHVSISRLNNVCNSVFSHWNWTSNNNVCAQGTRIILGWDPSIVQLIVVITTNQVVHCLAVFHSGKKFYVSFVYAVNNYIQRRQLWKDLSAHKKFMGQHP
ncbi:uncharacterized protein [Rutidosis leptorrhynchoides]|uniref:uncharacterized protein n=1 Tax=Rutidosis leptorrhynchoides TaxID=125765 RepID=UPI003A9A23BE